MSAGRFVPLDDRGILAVGGADRVAFLQGLVSNDVAQVSGTRACYAGFLTAQGKYLHDFPMVEHDGVIWLDGEAARLDDLRRRLAIYRLRAQVSLALVPELAVAALFGAGVEGALGLTQEAGAARSFNGGVAFVDPRLTALGVRVVLPRESLRRTLVDAGFAETDFAAYDRHRLRLGIPDGSRDLVLDKSILLEAGFDELNGVDWQKGCYMGQELTARTKYRALIKKRLLPVDVEGALPAPHTPITLGDHEAGELRSGRDGRALALLRLETVTQAEAEGKPFSAGAARLRPRKPDWAKF